MKFWAFPIAAVAALTILSLDGATRADVPSAASQKPPTVFRLSPNDTAAEKACQDKGGSVKDEDGMKMCSLSRSCPAPGGATRTIKLDTADPQAAKKCQDACGTVSTDNTGAQVCTKPEGR